MGFSGLTVYGSDMAADLFCEAKDAFVKVLECDFEKEANCYNTPGWLNVSMIIIEMCDHFMWFCDERFMNLVDRCIKALEANPEYGPSTKPLLKKLLKMVEKYA